VVIGGSESGIDVAHHLIELGDDVTVLDSTAPWGRRESDSSYGLSPYVRPRSTLSFSVIHAEFFCFICFIFLFFLGGGHLRLRSTHWCFHFSIKSLQQMVAFAGEHNCGWRVGSAVC
jgi:hypothetical protein